MTYPGNAALSPDVQDRIVETFEQTLALAAQGKLQEARLGCDFVLRLDPTYAPAQELTTRLESASGPVAVDDLSPSAPPAAAELPEVDVPPEPAAATEHEAHRSVDSGSQRTRSVPRAEVLRSAVGDALEPLDDPELKLPDLPPAAAKSLTAQLQELLDSREFGDLASLAESRRDEVMASPEARKLVELAGERREADPYVSNFLDSARLALQTGDATEVEALLQKARSLDPSHPGILEIEEAKTQYADPERLMGGRRVSPAADDEPAAALSMDEGFEEMPPLLGPASASAEESDPRIAELLEEGQAAFDRGELQTAIDAWSRIFLIDIDHQEASRRIEEARRRKAEQERKVEELFHDALAKVDSGDLEPAKELLQQVLEHAPNHLSAREALDQLEAGQTPTVLQPEPAAAGLLELTAPLEADGDQELKEEILVPPEPGQAPAPTLPPPPMVGKAKESRRSVLLVASVVLVLGLGWVVYSNWGRLFPNAGEEIPTAPVAPVLSPIERAQALHEEGKTAIAIAQLKRLPPDHADYQQAQARVAEWEKEAAEGEPVPSLPAEEQAKFDRLLEAGRRANAERRHLIAVELFERARLIAPLAETDEQRFDDSQRQVLPLATLIEYLKVSEYEVALPKLWQLRLEDPANEDVRYLIVTAYFNLGVRYLQRGALDKAREMFGEARELAPEDAELRRLQLLAQTYQERGEDLLLRIYVKYLPYRQL